MLHLIKIKNCSSKTPRKCTGRPQAWRKYFFTISYIWQSTCIQKRKIPTNQGDEEKQPKLFFQKRVQGRNGQKSWTDTSQKKPTKWPIITWNDTQHYKSSGKCEFRFQWDPTTHPLEWLKSRRLTIPSAGETEGATEILVGNWCKYKIVQPLRKTIWRLLIKQEYGYPVI